MRMMLLAAALLATPVGVSLPTAAAAQVADPALAQVLADSRRAADKARDQYRHPGETLEFFQVKPGMTVVDYLPAGGWIRAFLGLDMLYRTTSAFTLAKCIRDNQESRMVTSRVDQARLEKLLAEHDPFAGAPLS